MTSAYISRLREEHRRCDKADAGKPKLRDRVIAWYSELPEVAKGRPFAIAEIERALDTQGKYLSSVLLELGWRRRRRWSSTGQYNRYWVPPNFSDLSG
jgi:hypothetical protein